MLKSDMEIKRLGKKSLLIKGKKESLLVNPENETKQVARIHLFSETKNIMTETDKAVVIAGPGEYEVGGIEITGIRTEDTGLFYIIDVDGVRIGLVSQLVEQLNDKKMERVGEVDVLLLDIGEENGKKTKIILEMAKKLGANYVIPYGYSEGSASLKSFLDETDNEGKEPVEALKVEKLELPEGMEVVLLKIYG
jgi:L-ascorbate metabolism protein UlaG (beta-lactamase superfamily)